MSKDEKEISSLLIKEENNKANKLQSKTDAEEWERLKQEFYGTNCSGQTKWGIINFNPEDMKDVVGGKRLTYDEYLDIMKESGNKTRHYFELCYYNCLEYDFKGQIEKKSKGNICFKRIFGMYNDGTFFDGKEDHVWMSKDGFEKYKVGDCLSFTAEIYRYLKTGNGKIIYFSLKNPKDINRIDEYQIPSDDDLLMQIIDQFVCEEVCMFNKHCYMGMCIANTEWRENMKNILFDAIKRK